MVHAYSIHAVYPATLFPPIHMQTYTSFFLLGDTNLPGSVFFFFFTNKSDQLLSTLLVERQSCGVSFHTTYYILHVTPHFPSPSPERRGGLLFPCFFWSTANTVGGLRCSMMQRRFEDSAFFFVPSFTPLPADNDTTRQLTTYLGYDVDNDSENAEYVDDGHLLDTKYICNEYIYIYIYKHDNTQWALCMKDKVSCNWLIIDMNREEKTPFPTQQENKRILCPLSLYLLLPNILTQKEKKNIRNRKGEINKKKNLVPQGPK